MEDTRRADQRLVLAGFGPGALLGVRGTQVALAALVATAATVAVAATVFTAAQWPLYAAGSLLLALTYAAIGVLLGPLLGRVAGVLVAFLIPALDVGVAQDPMLYARPPGWAQGLPGYGATRVLLDGALTTTFTETTALLIALAWLTGLLVAATVLFRRPAGIGRPFHNGAAPAGST